MWPQTYLTYQCSYCGYLWLSCARKQVVDTHCSSSFIQPVLNNLTSRCSSGTACIIFITHAAIRVLAARHWRRSIGCCIVTSYLSIMRRSRSKPKLRSCGLHMQIRQATCHLGILYICIDNKPWYLYPPALVSKEPSVVRIIALLFSQRCARTKTRTCVLSTTRKETAV